MRTLRNSILLLFAGAFLSGHVSAGPLRIALLSDTSIQSDTILLAHLLPPNVPLEIRQRAEHLTFGYAPELGSARTLSRTAIDASLRAGGFVPAEFIVPETVIVRRTSRLLNREEVARAMQAALSSSGKTAPFAVRSEAVELQAAISAPSGDARLAVTEMCFDKQTGRMRFRLRPAASLKTPQFYAWYSPEEDWSPRLSPRLPGALSHSPAGAPNAAATLVEPRRLARLYLHSANMSTVLLVRPLQSGQNGETVRVRIPVNGRTLLARVVGVDLVDAGFQEQPR
jgi:hypothetical protein